MMTTNIKSIPIFSICAIQPKVATGQDQSSKTTVRVYGFCMVNAPSPYYWAVGWMPKPDYSPRYGYRLIAEVEVTHPHIMCGTQSDVANEFCNLAEEKLLREALLERDDYGRIWVKHNAWEVSHG